MELSGERWNLLLPYILRNYLKLWSLYGSTDLSGTVVYGNFSFTAPDGEGFYEFYTQAVDTSDQEETISEWDEMPLPLHR